MPPDPDEPPAVRPAGPDELPTARPADPAEPRVGYGDGPSRRPRPTPMSDPWAFPDEPPRRQAGLSIALMVVVIGGLVVFIIAVVIASAYLR